jgi:hypothetical protein
MLVLDVDLVTGHSLRISLPSTSCLDCDPRLLPFGLGSKIKTDVGTINMAAELTSTKLNPESHIILVTITPHFHDEAGPNRRTYTGPTTPSTTT